MSFQLSGGMLDIIPNLSISAASAITVTLCLCILLYFWQTDALDPQEPPLAPSRIPYIGHMIGMLWYHNDYFSIINDQFPSPICTLKIFSTRMYIISSPELTQAAFRNSKDIDFDSIVQAASCRVVGFDQHGTDIVCFVPEKGESSYMTELHHEMYGSLAKGPILLETNARVLNCLARYLNQVSIEPQPKSLFRWMRDFYTVSSAEALYGPDNPISKNPSLIQSTWDFENDLGMLALDFMPAVTAPKGHKARLAIAPAFEEYYNAGLEKNASGFVQGRARAARNWGFTTEEISKAEVTIISASVTNTVPNVFFMVCNIFANSKLVSSLREEIHKIVTRISREGTDKLSLDISMIENHCPLLISCYYESMRLNKTGASTRMALSDVMLNDQYLLKKGSIIQIATGVLQSDVNTWGADAKEFNGWRFIAKDTLLKEAKKSQTQAWIPFGGGRNLCPGRHLAFTEITAFVAMMVYGFELTMNDGSVLSVPKARHQKLGVGSKSPKHDLEVVIRRRGEFEGSTWVFNAHTMEP